MTPSLTLTICLFYEPSCWQPRARNIVFHLLPFHAKIQHLRTEFITGVVFFFIELSASKAPTSVLELLIFCAHQVCDAMEFPILFLTYDVGFYELCVWVRASLNSSLVVVFDLDTFVLQKSLRPHYFVGALWSKVESELDTLRRLHEFVKHQTLKKICRI